MLAYKPVLALVAVALVGTTFVGEAAALNPSRTYKQKPDKFNMEYKEHKVRTNDGAATLVAWHFRAKKKSASTVLVAHSGEGNMADYLRRVDTLRAEHNVVIFDYRGFGESSEFEIDKNMYVYPHFQDDMASMIDHTRKTHSASFNIYGWGIGGGLALGVGFGRPEAKAIVADTPFFSMEDLEERFSSWDTPMEVPFAGYEKRFEPHSTLDGAPGKNLKKITLIVGSNDRVYKLADMQALQSKNKVTRKLIDKDIFVVENPDRKDNFRVAKAAYTARLMAGLATK
jgi:pimeloyl-ACP methyl ester carboxylesterase